MHNLPPACTFEREDWLKLASYWYPVALSRDISNQPVAAKLIDEPLVIYRVHNEVVVARDICPHRGVPLSMGHGEDDGVVCAYHGLRFGAGGRCNLVPAQPDAEIPAKLVLRTYPVAERYGLIWTCLRPEDGAQPAIPPMPHWEDPAFQQITCPTIDIFGFAGRQLEGFIDVAHFGFVHLDTFGDPANTRVPSYRPVATPDGFEVEYRSTIGNYPIGVDNRAPAGFEWLRHFRVHPPFTATLTVHFPEGGRLVIMNAASPVSAKARGCSRRSPAISTRTFLCRRFTISIGGCSRRTRRSWRRRSRSVCRWIPRWRRISWRTGVRSRIGGACGI